MTNTEIIINECISNKLFTKDELEKMTEIPVHTYQYWKELGYQVRKGEKAAIKTKLWKQITFKTEDGASAKKLILAAAALFTSAQVDKIETETSAPEKKTSSAAEKRTSSAQKKTSSVKAKKTLTKKEAEDNLKKIEETPVQLVKKEEQDPDDSDIEAMIDEFIEAPDPAPEYDFEKDHDPFTLFIKTSSGPVRGEYTFNMKDYFPMTQRDFKIVLNMIDESANKTFLKYKLMYYLHNQHTYFSDTYKKAKLNQLKNNIKLLSAVL